MTPSDTVTDIRSLIAEGVRAERAGALDRAAESYGAAASRTDDPAVQSEALAHLADVYRIRCEWDRALQYAHDAQAIAEAPQLARQACEAVIAEINIMITRGDFASAIPKCEAIAFASDGEPRLKGIALQSLGAIYAQTGQERAAERAFRESLGCFLKADYRRGQGIALNNLGRLAVDSNDACGARELLEQALAAASEVEDADLAALVSMNMASALCLAGEVDLAEDCAMAALGYFAECNNRWREIECLQLIADINVRCQDIENALRCFDLGLKLSEQIGAGSEARACRERIDALSRERRSGTPSTVT